MVEYNLRSISLHEMSSRTLSYWIKQLCLWLCQPLIICFVVASWFLDSTLTVHHESQFSGQLWLCQSLIYAFHSLLIHLSTTLAVHSDSIGSVWDSLFSTGKVWVHNLLSGTIFGIQQISGRLIFVGCAQCHAMHSVFCTWRSYGLFQFHHLFTIFFIIVFVWLELGLWCFYILTSTSPPST